LVKFAIKRGERPKFISNLIVDTTSDKASPAKQRRKSYKRQRAAAAVRALWPTGVPDQSTLPNGPLCKQVVDWLEKDSKQKNIQTLPISDDTILRAAGRSD
jgi:hypothetical protein